MAFSTRPIASRSDLTLQIFVGHLGRFPFGQKFRKFRFGTKWKTFFRFARPENSQKKWNYGDYLLSSSTFFSPFVHCMLTCIVTWVRVTRWSPPLAVYTCFVVSDTPSFRKSPSIRLKFGHSESHGTRSLFVVPRQLCQGYASLNGLAWLLMHE